jgi:uncharacterized iron-regulated protein
VFASAAFADRVPPLVATTPSFAVERVQTRQTVKPSSWLQQLANADVVYLGETHDRAADHQAQLHLIQQLHQQQPKLTIGMEMFQRPFQPILNQYLAGKLTETELQARSQYKQRWGYDWEFYAPILRFAQAQRLPVIALNTPTEITRKVARSGLDSLTWIERRWIPPRSAIVLGPNSYRQRLQTIYAEIHHGKTQSQNFERFFQAQVLWDETMAERIAQVVQQQPDTLMIVLVGQGHLLYGDGIPDRVARRIPSVQQVSILLNPAVELKQSSDRPIADYFLNFPAQP